MSMPMQLWHPDCIAILKRCNDCSHKYTRSTYTSPALQIFAALICSINAAREQLILSMCEGSLKSIGQAGKDASVQTIQVAQKGMHAVKINPQY